MPLGTTALLLALWRTVVRRLFQCLKAQQIQLENHLIRTFADHTFICGGSDNRLIVKYLGNDFSRDLLNHLTELLNVNAKAIEVKKIDEVPRNAYGKIMYE